VSYQKPAINLLIYKSDSFTKVKALLISI
jgi:hypothetical protein